MPPFLMATDIGLRKMLSSLEESAVPVTYVATPEWGPHLEIHLTHGQSDPEGLYKRKQVSGKPSLHENAANQGLPPSRERLLCPDLRARQYREGN